MTDRRSRIRPARVAVALTLVATFAALAFGPLEATSSAVARTVAPEPLLYHTFAAHATWQGNNLTSASDSTHAFRITTNQQILVKFGYSEPTGGPTITTARIQAIYFGSVISTNQVSASSHAFAGGATGNATMNWTLGTFTYLLAGTYLLTASLVSSTGSTVWSESFYINAVAPYYVASGLIVFLLILGAVELWSIATVARGPKVRGGRTPASQPPEPWDSGTPPAGAAPTAPADESEPAPPTPAADPPPPPEESS